MKIFWPKPVMQFSYEIKVYGEYKYGLNITASYKKLTNSYFIEIEKGDDVVVIHDYFIGFESENGGNGCFMCPDGDILEMEQYDGSYRVLKSSSKYILDQDEKGRWVAMVNEIKEKLTGFI